MIIRLGSLLLFFLFLLSGKTFAQNDLCSNASVIIIPNNGFALGTFTSTTSNITAATIENGETFAPAILTANQNQKSVWYTFTLPTTRSLRISLFQSGSGITAGDVGFAVYKSNACLPNIASISNKLTPITTFGNTFHPCVESGIYLVQVSAKANVSGIIFLQIESGNSSGLYDLPANAYDFGTLSEGVKTISYAVECQSLEDVNEVCPALANASLYTKSSWHVFTTASYFDYLAILLSNQNLSLSNAIGFKLYEGDVRNAPYSSLNIIDDCDSLVPNQYAARKIYGCDVLNTNATYSVQLFFKNNYTDNIQLTFITGGSAPTNAPSPILSAVPSSNRLGALPASSLGITTTATDRHACNSRHTVNACSPAVPNNGVEFNGLQYKLSSFFTFSITGVSNVNILALQSSCFSNLLVRLYKQGLTNNCASLDTTNLVAEGLTALSFNCFEPGDYTLQIVGRDSIFPPSNYFSGYGVFTNNSNPFCGLTGLGQLFNVRIDVQTAELVGSYNLSAPGAYHPINFSGGNLQPLVVRNEYTSIDTFSCRNTVLPLDTLCAPSITKGIYRTFTVADSGIVTLKSFTPPIGSTFSKLYAGNANTLATNQNAHQYPETISGLSSYSLCTQYNIDNSNPLKACIIPGVYTYVTFGDDDNVSNENTTTIQFDTIKSKFNDPSRAEDLGDITTRVSPNGGFFSTETDIFSCIDNAVPIDGLQPCSISGTTATKAIYRQFYLSKPASISISSDNNCAACRGGLLTLFSGKASDGLNNLSHYAATGQCNSTIEMEICEPLPVGWYTIVSYGIGANFQNQSTATTTNFTSNVGRGNRYVITVNYPCEVPKYNRPYKAAIDTITRLPFLIEWGERSGSTAAYPKTDTTYILYKENYNCTTDTPFVSHPIISCSNTANKVTYYVFQTTQDSYISINTFGLWGAVYAGDVRIDSASFTTSTPIQSCLRSVGKIQICNLQPGVYTLVLFASDEETCLYAIPEIYIDRTGYARFDHATNAYDFGVVAPDSTYYFGKPGDVHPTDPNRNPSDDIIYCTTGARSTDPNQYGCVAVNPNIYASNLNNSLYSINNPGLYGINARRNLWYTFVIDKPGTVRVHVNSKTPGKNIPLKFAVYKSDVDGNIPFIDLANSGQLDSTIAQGLSLVSQNAISGCVPNSNSATFNIDPCSPITSRYFIIVDNVNTFPLEISGGVQPNNQLDVAVLFDSVAVINDPGDFCNNPIVATLNGPGTINATAIVNCHTIGTDYGEYNTTITCPNGGVTTRYKSFWFRIDITGQDTLDVTLFLTASTNVDPSLIKHRLMKGNCGAMEEGSCVQDILTQNTYKCLRPGSYFIQVLIPSRINFNPFPPVEGTIQLNLSAVPYADACAPENNCLSTANFSYAFNCNTSDITTFTNNSTFGSDISYQWDFGYNGQTSNETAPTFSYPVLPTDITYNVTLNVNNNSCGGFDSYSIPVTIPARPSVNLGNDTTLCTPGSSFTLNATSINGSTYSWQDGSSNATFIASTPGSRVYGVSVNYNGCIARDAITVNINPIVSQNDSILSCDSGFVILNSYRGFGENYSWNTGQQTSSIQVNNSGTYINNIDWNGCEVADTFNITKGPLAIELSSSASICIGEPYTLPWGVTVNTPGTYRDTIPYPFGCDSVRTTVYLIEKPVTSSSSDVSICNGATYTLPWGLTVNSPGVYADTLKYINGCDSLIQRVNVSSLVATMLNESIAICPDSSYQLPWGLVVNTSGNYSDTIRSVSGCDSLIHIIEINLRNASPLQITKSNDIGCNLTSSSLSVSGGTLYEWSPSTYLNDPFSSITVATPPVTTMFYIQSTSSDGCILRDSVEVSVNANAENFYLIPSAFSPNNDGLNDCFGVKHWGNLTYLSFSIYNRWGELLFKSHNPANCWDGRYKGKMQFAGTYVYQIYADGPCGKVFKKGTVILIR